MERLCLGLTFLICFGYGAPLHAAKGKYRDLFLDHFKQFTNRSVDPCDNFYRHTCSHAITMDKEITNNYIDSKALAGIRSKYAIKEFEIELRNKLIQSVQRGEDSEEDRQRYKFARGLRERQALLEYIQEEKLLTQEEYSGIRADTNRVVRKMIEQVKKSSTLLSATTYHNYTNLAENLLVIIGSANEMVYDHLPLYMDIYNSLQHFYEGYKKLSRRYRTRKTVALKQIIEHIDEFFALDPIAVGAVLMGASWNAFNVPPLNTLRIQEAALLVGSGTSRPAYYGGVVSVYGHEIIHSFITTNYTDKDEKLQKNKKCLERHMEKTCRTFAPEESLGKHTPCTAASGCPCNSGPLTYLEDSADQEGVQLAYLAFVDEIGEENLHDPAYPDEPELAGITNQKMFFYAVGAVFCEENANSAGEGHSVPYARVNGMLSVMNAFHETFQCSPESRLGNLREAKENQCNQIGDAVRRFTNK